MNKLNHTMGTDPEAFIFKDSRSIGGYTVPVIIPPAALIEDFGVKFEIIDDKKVLLKDEYEGAFQWSEDGAAIELQMLPTNSITEFTKRLSSAKRLLDTYLRKLDLRAVTNSPVGYFDLENYWKNRDENFQSCVIFGCDPDIFPELYLDMGLDKESEEIDVSEHEYRYGGGHIHIQSPEENPYSYIENWSYMSIVFDFIVGIQNVLLTRNDKEMDMEIKRLEYYGRPGRVRLQSYDPDNEIFGIEYRPLSNLWTSKPQFTKLLLRSMDTAAGIIDDNYGEQFIDHFVKTIPDMYATLLTMDTKLAKEIQRNTFKWLFENEIITTKEMRLDGYH